uniref:Uncharacterized protein n=1 Tax=Oryza punctata TaxID=4537 RepID=A0A0E0JVC3_ORYPU
MADTFHVRRINMSRFIYPEPLPPPPTPVMVVDARVPRPCITFCAPSIMNFMLFGRGSDRVLAVDHKDRTTMYDPGANAIGATPTLTNPKKLPAISVAVGDNLYILDPTSSDDHCFEALVYKPGGPAKDWAITGGPIDLYNDWHCQSLPPPPYSCSFVAAYGAIGAYAVVGGGDSAQIWVSTNGGGTLSFDTARRDWTKHGDWTLPFRGLAEYVPEYNLWFGLSNNNNNHLCAFDLAGAASRKSPPATRNFHPRTGSRLLRHADMNMDTETYGVFTGVEVKPGRGLRMVKHRIMSLRRRFVYLVLDGRCKRRASLDAYVPATYHLHRINTSRFFYPGSPPAAADVANAMADARLPPRPCMTFYGPSANNSTGRMDFMLFGRDRDMVLAADQKGRATIYDPLSNAVRAAPALTKPKELCSVSVAVGDNLYILDPTSSREHSFEALIYKPGGKTDDYGGRFDRFNDWHCRSLPPPPYEPYSCSFDGAYCAVGAYAVVGGSDIWVSTNGAGTFSFDTARHSWTKQGDWKLPFCGHAEYVPEHNLWFGLSSNHLCTFDLAGAAKRQSPPSPRNVWEDLKTPKDWQPVTSYLLHLGSGRFCIARFFHSKFKVSCCHMETETYGVFSGVEVEPCGKAGRGLRMVKHRSECYHWDDILLEWVL